MIDIIIIRCVFCVCDNREFVMMRRLLGGLLWRAEGVIGCIWWGVVGRCGYGGYFGGVGFVDYER